MPLESLGPDKKPNVKRASTETPEAQLRLAFDIDEEVEPELQEKMLMILNNEAQKKLNSNKGKAISGRTLSESIFTFPDKAKKILDTEKVIENIKTQMIICLDQLEQSLLEDEEEEPFVMLPEDNEIITRYCKLAFVLKCIEKENGFELKIPHLIQEKYDLYFKYIEVSGAEYEIGLQAKLIWPDEPNEYDESLYSWQKMENLIRDLENEEAWENICDLVPYIKLVYPDEFKSFKFSQQTWKKLKRYFSDKKEHYYKLVREKNFFAESQIPDLMKIIGALNILAADDARLTNQGLEIQMRPESEQKTETVPEIKNY